MNAGVLQTSLVWSVNKACLLCKEGFFTTQRSLLFSYTLYILFRHGAELVVPFLPEAAHERPFKEAIDGQTEFATLLHGIVADIPTVVVEGYGTVGEAFLADGVEGARDGLDELCLALTVGAFEGAEAAAVVVAGEDAVLAAHDAGDEVALTVGVGYALLVDDGLRLCRHIAPDGVEGTLYAGYFVEGDGCAGVAFDAADAFAGVEVAAELLGDDVRGDEDGVYI